MFDNLREDASQPFYEEEAKFQSDPETMDESTAAPSRFLGMTAVQRFVIAILLMAAVCVIGTMLLFVTNKIGF